MDFKLYHISHGVQFQLVLELFDVSIHICRYLSCLAIWVELMDPQTIWMFLLWRCYPIRFPPWVYSSPQFCVLIFSFCWLNCHKMVFVMALRLNTSSCALGTSILFCMTCLFILFVLRTFFTLICSSVARIFTQFVALHSLLVYWQTKDFSFNTDNYTNIF